MSWDSCNRHASLPKAGSERVWTLRRDASRSAKGKHAQSRLPLLGFFLAALVAVAHGADERFGVDAVLPVVREGESHASAWRLFSVSKQRFAQLPADSAAWAEDGWTRAEWKALSSPGGSFRPVQVVQAARGYFLLVDAASSRLCLYDTSGGVISTFPLPERFTPFSAGRMAVFRGVDGTFIFADYASGEAWQYADREAAQGAANWVLRARVKMPVGWRDCYQPPGSEGLACRVGAGAARFDGSLNRASGAPKPLAGSSVEWDPEKREWVLSGAVSAGDRPLFRYRPAASHLASP